MVARVNVDQVIVAGDELSGADLRRLVGHSKLLHE